VPVDPNECRANAMRCRKLATETNDLFTQEILIEIAHSWERIASKAAAARELLGQPPDQQDAA